MPLGPAVPAPEIEKPIDMSWKPFEERAFALSAMRNPIGARQILERMIGRGPLVGLDIAHEGM
jgi:hypothetical protein